MSEQWLSIVEYARQHALSDMTVRRRIKTGHLQAVLRDGKYYIPVGAERPSQPMRPERSAYVPPHDLPSEKLPSNDAYQRQTDSRTHTPIVESRTVATRMEGSRLLQTPSPGTIGSESNYERGLIPSHLRMGLSDSAYAAVDTKALLDFCDSVLRRFTRTEGRLEESFRHKVALLDAQLAAKDVEINKLQQQIEDLQLLVKVLEKKS